MDMVNMSKRQQPHGDEKHQLKTINKRRGNPRTTGQVVVGPKTLNTCTAK